MFGKLQWYKRNKTLRVVLLKENNQLQGGNSGCASSHQTVCYINKSLKHRRVALVWAAHLHLRVRPTLGQRLAQLSVHLSLFICPWNAWGLTFSLQPIAWAHLPLSRSVTTLQQQKWQFGGNVDAVVLVAGQLQYRRTLDTQSLAAQRRCVGEKRFQSCTQQDVLLGFFKRRTFFS